MKNKPNFKYSKELMDDVEYIWVMGNKMLVNGDNPFLELRLEISKIQKAQANEERGMHYMQQTIDILSDFPDFPSEKYPKGKRNIEELRQNKTNNYSSKKKSTS